MSLKTAIEHKCLHFHKPAGTSRGVYNTHDVWYVRIFDTEHPELIGIGEAAPLHDLSVDFGDDYVARLKKACAELENSGVLDVEALREQPSILFALETAMQQLKRLQQRETTSLSSTFALWDTPFSRSEAGIPINGLIWMGPFRDMEAQIQEKLKNGFRCIKLKIGAIDFKEELSLLQRIRHEYSSETVTLRVDANGAFSPTDALEKLNRLAELDLHSIEQPIRAGQWEALAGLIKTSPLPIALDEELIGVFGREEKLRLLDFLKPPFLVLKPTLHGGMAGCTEWIQLAQERGIGWWTTSALESNIGLNAVAQWCATLNNPLHQGLGTGLLYSDNVEMPLVIEGEKLWFRP